MLKSLTTIALALLLVGFAGTGTPFAASDQVTGCLSSKGKLSNFALGPSPAKPCKGKDTQISFGGEGPEGPPGPPGDEGPPGSSVELLDDDDLLIGTVLGVESAGRATVYVSFPFHPRAFVLHSLTSFGDSTFLAEQTAWFTQFECAGPAYAEPGIVLSLRNPEIETAFVVTDNAGAVRLYIGDEVLATVEVLTKSHLTGGGCNDKDNDPPRDMTPLILLDPDLLSTFPSPHTLDIP